MGGFGPGRCQSSGFDSRRLCYLFLEILDEPARRGSEDLVVHRQQCLRIQIYFQFHFHGFHRNLVESPQPGPSLGILSLLDHLVTKRLGILLAVVALADVEGSRVGWSRHSSARDPARRCVSALALGSWVPNPDTSGKER